jgi:hypothetical protein
MLDTTFNKKPYQLKRYTNVQFLNEISLAKILNG